MRSGRSNAKINYDGILFMLDKFCGAAWLGLSVHMFGSGLGYQVVHVLHFHVWVSHPRHRHTDSMLFISVYGEGARERRVCVYIQHKRKRRKRSYLQQ